MQKAMRSTGGGFRLLAFLVAGALTAACGNGFELAEPDGGRDGDTDVAAADAASAPRDVGSGARDASDGGASDSRGVLPDQLVDARARDAPSVLPPMDAPSDSRSDAARREAGRDAPAMDARDASAPDAEGGSAGSDGAAADATSDQASADAAILARCDVLTTFYRDRDGDGYGSVDDHLAACQAPPVNDAGAWVTAPGDCRDDLASVRPDPNNPGMREARYTAQGYADPTKPGGVSFDINCDGVEDADPANLFGTEPSCPILIPGCTGEGYVAASPERTGPTVNEFCGSTTVKRCVIVGLGCRSELAEAAEPFRCH